MVRVRTVRLAGLVVLLAALLVPAVAQPATARAASIGCETYYTGDTCSISQSGSTYTLTATFTRTARPCANGSDDNCLTTWDLLSGLIGSSSVLQSCNPTWHELNRNTAKGDEAHLYDAPNIPATVTCSMQWQSGQDPRLPADVFGTQTQFVAAWVPVCVDSCPGSEDTITHGVALTDDRTIAGTVLQGRAPDSPFAPARPEKGVAIAVSGTTADGQSYLADATTAADGGYGFSAPPGSYTLRLPDDVCLTTNKTTCVTHKSVTVDANGDLVTVDAVSLRGSMAVTVTPAPRHTKLTVNKKTGKLESKTIKVTVGVTNDGRLPLTDITPADKLVVGYHDPKDVSVSYVPLRPDTGPKPKSTAALKPGKSTEFSYTLLAKGDGKFDAQAVITAGDAKGRIVKAAGTAQVLLGSPVLIEKTSMGRVVHSGRGGLIKAGTNFSIHLELQNVSYTKKIAVAPLYCDSSGNASDGHTQSWDDPIQNVPASQDVLSKAFTLEPRKKADLACVLHTTSVPTATLAGDGRSGGGTRATVTVPTPDAWEIKDNAKGAKVADADEFIDGETSFTVSLDDSDERPEPEPGSLLGDYLYFSKGQLTGLWNLTAGAASGLFTVLPRLVGSGIRHVPSALIGYVQTEMELFNTIKRDPAKLALFLDPVENAALLMYEKTPELIGNVSNFKARIDKEVLDGYTKVWNDWYGGNRQAALEEFGREFEERSGDVIMAVAPGLLARDAKVLNAFKTAGNRLYAQVTEDLASYLPTLVDAIEANRVMNTVMKSGLEMSNAVLRKFYGLTDAEAQFLRNLAVRNKLSIVIRSRATQSIAWIKRFGAVLKPELIKIKNVSWLDYQYLGYAEEDIGRVAIRTKLPTAAQVEAKLRAHGFAPHDAEWTDALKRLAQRQEELTTKDPGNYKNLEALAKDGKVKIKFNLADNDVDPTAGTEGTHEYGFRLAPKPGERDTLVPQFRVGGKWRSVTGDVDFLQITNANGTPLSDAERVAVYRKIATSVVGFMHPETATWTKFVAGGAQFDFAKKVNEFVRGGIVAQFAPDGAARAVRFDKDLSYFGNKLDYRIRWDGGYVLPQGPAKP